jgi:hypothetical protein
MCVLYSQLLKRSTLIEIHQITASIYVIVHSEHVIVMMQH